MTKRKRERFENSDINYLNKKIRKLERKINRGKRRSDTSSSDSDNVAPHNQLESDMVTVVDNTTPDGTNMPGCSYWSDWQYSTYEQPAEEVDLDALLAATEPPTAVPAAAVTDFSTAVPATAAVAPTSTASVNTPTALQENVPSCPAEQVPELDAELLEILGKDPACIKEYGDDIQKDLAVRLNHIVTAGLSKESRKELREKYLIPANCKLIKAPTLNPEIKASLIESQVKRDKGIEFKQQMTSCGLSALSAGISLLLSSENKNPELLKLLMDSARIFGDIQHEDSLSRRFFILSTVKKELKEQLEKTKIDDTLFGSNLLDILKSAKFINKSGADIRASTTMKSTIQRPVRPHSRSLNFKAPPATRKPPPGGARPPRAAHPVSTPRQPTTTPPPTHFNAARPSSRQPQARFRR